ncbi:unnamed protein product, partial [Allacma fusca]
IARRFAEVNQNQGHNHLAVVDRSYHITNTEEIRKCEEKKYFTMKDEHDSCGWNEVFLGILSEILNFTVTSGDFTYTDGTKVLRICITLCYSELSYVLPGETVNIFISSIQKTNFLYCRRTETLETPGWEFLTDCFDYFVWSCIVASVILIGVALQS